jgi:hypothetical protein
MQRQTELYASRWWPLDLRLQMLFMAIIFFSLFLLGVAVLIRDIMQKGF